MRLMKREKVFSTKNRWPFGMNLFSASTRTVIFLQPNRGKGSEAWSVLCRRFKSFERPRLQKQISDLSNLRKCDNERIVDYITRAEDMQLNNSEVNQSISEKMFVSILLKVLPREFENLCTLVKYGQDKTLD